MCRVIIVCTLLFTSCVAKRLATTTTEQDSVRVEVRERVEYVTDTISVALPYISEYRETRDTLSRLENDYALSVAAVSGGTLFHSLETKPQVRVLSFKRPIHSRDSIVYRNFYRNIETEVKKDLSWLQKAQINGFWALLILIAITLIIRWIFGRS